MSMISELRKLSKEPEPLGLDHFAPKKPAEPEDLDAAIERQHRAEQERRRVPEDARVMGKQIADALDRVAVFLSEFQDRRGFQD